MFSQSIILSLALGTLAAPFDFVKRQSCPQIHVFGARETTASPGYGSAGSVVQAILNSHSGATAEAIDYPASGSNPTYSQSVQAGNAALVSQVSSFAAQCPDTKLVLVGYSQGAEIFDNTLCGGGDPNQGISENGSIAQYNIVAAIFMGDPRFQAGAPYNVGTCSAGGFDARPSGQRRTYLMLTVQTTCGNFNSDIQSYCDAADPYCCNGNDANTHDGYASEYGQAALNFVNSKLA